MKILAFVDTHANKIAMRELGRKAQDVDIVICAGDISIFGRGMQEMLAEMDSWNKPVLCINGNHEDEEEMAELVKQTRNLHFLHGTEVTIGDLSIVGWGGGGFAQNDEELEEFAKMLKPSPLRIMFFHGPPFNTAIDFQPWSNSHVGCRSRRKVIEDLQPFLAIAGHIHECFGKASTIGKTNVLNPGPLGVMIELKSKEHQTTEEKKQPDTKKEIKEDKRSGKDTIGKSAKKSGVKTSVAKNKSAGGKKK